MLHVNVASGHEMTDVARWSELKLRTASALLVGSAVLFITWYDPISFCTMLLVAFYLLIKEWRALTAHRNKGFLYFGVAYLGAGVFSLAFMHIYFGWAWMYVFFAVVWSADIGAYLVGKKWGARKIAPHISPGKSWEGLAGGVIASILTIYAAHLLMYPTTPGGLEIVAYTLIGATLTVIGLLGDLFESSLKRHAGVKDSGTLLPGHGGLFDRVDALIPCAIATAFVLLGFRAIGCHSLTTCL
jgi:phosphatidate cytidylyltransferase